MLTGPVQAVFEGTAGCNPAGRPQRAPAAQKALLAGRTAAGGLCSTRQGQARGPVLFWRNRAYSCSRALARLLIRKRGSSMQPNLNFSRLGGNYLFSEVRARTRAFCEAHPGVRVTDLGVGDVTLPLAAPVVRALRAACAEMGRRETFRGYGPAEGYAFLREALAARYARLGAHLARDIFVSDGAKSDLAAILALFSPHNTVLVPSPGYPCIWTPTLCAGGRCTPWLPRGKTAFAFAGAGHAGRCGISVQPGNPTARRLQRTAWPHGCAGRWAAARCWCLTQPMKAFIQDKALPHSIYQIEGARECAIEIGSFFQSAGFTGLRCGWAVVPQALRAGGVPLRGLYARWRAISTNGVAYPCSARRPPRLSCEGRAAVAKTFRPTAKMHRCFAAALQQAGVWYCGAKTAPICGWKRRAAWALGRCLNTCCTRRACPARRAWALGQRARAISVCRPLAMPRPPNARSAAVPFPWACWRANEGKAQNGPPARRKRRPGAILQPSGLRPGAVLRCLFLILHKGNELAHQLHLLRRKIGRKLNGVLIAPVYVRGVAPVRAWLAHQPQQVIEGNIKNFRQLYFGLVVRVAVAALVTGNGERRYRKLTPQAVLRKPFIAPKFLQQFTFHNQAPPFPALKILLSSSYI